MPSRLYDLNWIYEKRAAVPSELKQFRKALIAHQGGYDYHAGNTGGILQSGMLREGGGDAFGKGVYFSRNKPEHSYWENSLFRGIITPTENVQKQYGRVVKPESPYSPAYSLVHSKYHVRPGDLAVVGPSDSPAVVREAQKKFRVRPVSSLAYFGSLLAQEGEPVDKVVRDLRDPKIRRALQSFLAGL